MLMSPGRNVSVGFTYITGITASTEKLINYMGYNEQKWLESDPGRLVKFYRRYVDDIFMFLKTSIRL